MCVRPRPSSCIRALFAALVLVVVLMLPSGAAAASIQPEVHLNRGQVTVVWTSSFAGSSELRWNARRADSYAEFPASNDESNRQSSGLRHSRTISDLEAGDYWFAVRTTALNGSVEESPVVRITVSPELAAGSMGQLDIDGAVTSTKTIGGRTFMAGDFGRIGIRTGAGVLVSTQDESRGDVIPGMPQINGTVHTSTSDNRGGWYIGGDFTRVGGLEMRGIAHLFPDGGVDPAFSPGRGFGETGSVRALDVDSKNFSPPRVYVGGAFAEYDGSPQNNIVAVNGATGQRDTSFVTTAGINTGTNAPVFAIKVDERLRGSGAGFEADDYSGVYIAGAFTYFRGMAMSRIAKLELSGNRARYAKSIPLDDSPEWAVVKAVVGTDAFTQSGWFESCGYGTPQSPTYKCELMSASAFRPTPIDDLDQAYAKEQVYARTAPVGPVVTTIDPGAPMRAITSLATYEQFRCATGMPMWPKPNGFLADIPIIGWFVTLSNAATAALNPTSNANRYMSDFMYDRVVRSYDQTILFGGRFENSDRTTTSTTLSGFNAATGTQDLTASDPSMTRLESFFPNLGVRLRADMTMVSSRLDQSGIDGTINSLVVSDAAGCDNDQAYVGGDFSFATNQPGVRGADIGRVNLTKQYDSKWKIDPSWFNVRTDKAGIDGKAVGTISLDSLVAPKQLTGAGTFAGIASNGTVTDRAGIVMLDVQSGEFKVQGMRDGADGAVLTVTDSGSRAFVGGNFSAYDSWKRAGLASISTTGGAAKRIAIHQTFAPSDRIAGDDARLSSMTSTAGRLFLGGRFATVGGAARGNLVAYDERTGRVDPMIGRAGGGPRGIVHALESTIDGRVVVGGEFDGYVARSADGATVASCECRNLVVIDAVTGLPYGMRPDGSGSYLYEDIDTDGPVEALALVPGTDRLYVGGDFDRVGSSAGEYGGLLGVRLTTGTIDEAFHATPGGTDGVVNVLVVSGDDLIVGGDFTAVRGATASNIAKLDLTTGRPDAAFNPAYRTDSGTDGPITTMVVLGNIVVFGGDFTEYNGNERSGIAAADLVTGNVIGGFAPAAGDIESIGLVGDDLVIGSADGTTSTASISFADVTSPKLSIDPATAISGGVSGGDTTFVRGAAGATLTLAVEANDVFDFDDLYNGGTLGLQTITWPAIPGVAPALEADMSSVTRLRLRCTGAAAGGAAAAPLELDVRDIAWSATRRPAGLDRFAGAADCTWTGRLVVPTNASGDFALSTSDAAMRVTAGGAFVPGATVPITVAWAGMPTNANPVLRWNDTAARFAGGTARPVPGAAFAPLKPFTRTYTFPDSEVPDGRYDTLEVSIVDQAQHAQKVTLPAITVDAHAPVASSVQLPPNAPKVSTGTIVVRVTPAGDGAGSGVASRLLQHQVAPFATSGTDRCAAATDPAAWTTIPGGTIPPDTRVAVDVPVQNLPEGCHRFRLVSTDKVGWTTHDVIDVAGGWAHVDVAGPTVDVTSVPAAIEGADVELGGTLADTGAGVAGFDVDIIGTERWDMCADATSTNRWQCAFDTTGAADGAYDLAVVGVDRLEQRGSEARVAGIHVDNVGPQVTVAVPVAGTDDAHHVVAADPADPASMPTVWFNPNVAGSFRLEASSTDDGFGGTVLLPSLAAGAEGWDVPAVQDEELPMARTAVARKTSVVPTATSRDATTYAWGVGAAEPGLVSVVGLETAGKRSSASLEVRADGDAPVGAAVAVADGSVIVETGSDAQSGIASTQLLRREAPIVAHATCGEWDGWQPMVDADLAAPITDEVVDRTCYEYQVVVTDRVGNRARATASTTRLVGDLPAPVPAEPTPTPAPDPTPTVTPDPPAQEPVPAEPDTAQPDATQPATAQPVTPAPVAPNPNVLRETPKPAVEPTKDEPVKDEPATRAPAEVAPQPDAVQPAATPEPTADEPVRETRGATAPAATTPVTTPKQATPTATPVVKPEVATTQAVASTPKRTRAAKQDSSWIRDTVGWVRKHPFGAAALGVAGAHVGSSLLFGKGLGALLAKLQGALGGHANPPLRLVRELAKRGRNLWTRQKRRSRRDDDEELLDDEDDVDVFEDRRAA